MGGVNLLSNINLESIPCFAFQEYKLLQDFGVEIPEGTMSLAGRVKEFHTVTNDLVKETSWNKTMPWIVAATEISLIAAAVLAFVFIPTPLVLISVALSVSVFEAGVSAAAKLEPGPVIPPLGSILYIVHLVTRQSKLEARHSALSQELPDAIREAAAFWQESGAGLLEKVNEATKNVPIFLPEPVKNESFKQMQERFETSRLQARDAYNRQTALENLARQIQIGQQLALQA